MSACSVLVLGDTHLTRGGDLPDAVLELADRADHVVHAGDFTTLDVLDTLEALAPVTAVHGNVCAPEVALRLPERTEVELAGVRLGVVHDAGRADSRHARLQEWFPECDVIVYGHSHLPELAWSGGTLVLNPGSCVQRRRAPAHTVAWLRLAGGAVDLAELVRIDDEHA